MDRRLHLLVAVLATATIAATTAATAPAHAHAADSLSPALISPDLIGNQRFCPPGSGLAGTSNTLSGTTTKSNKPKKSKTQQQYCSPCAADTLAAAPQPLSTARCSSCGGGSPTTTTLGMTGAVACASSPDDPTWPPARTLSVYSLPGRGQDQQDPIGHVVPLGLASSDGLLYIADPRGNRVLVADMQADETTLLAGGEVFNRPVAVAAQHCRDDVFVAEARRVVVVRGSTDVATLVDNVKPTALAIDNARRLLYVSTTDHRVLRVDLNTGDVSNFAGTASKRGGTGGDGGSAVDARLSSPSGVAVDEGTGDVYVSDAGNRRIRRIDAATGIITTIAGDGRAGLVGIGGPGVGARLSSPRQLSIGGGYLFVADDVALLQIELTSGDYRLFLAPTNPTPLVASASASAVREKQLDGASGVAWDPRTSDVYVSETRPDRILVATKVLLG